MSKGKIILIEGTDCSGKQTQAEKLVQNLNNANIKSVLFSFPMYDTPTGKIIGGPYLGKEMISRGFFSEGADKVDPKVASLYFAADRQYNINKINDKLKEGYTVILDRYVESNMAHQCGKIENLDRKLEMIDWIDKLEYGLLKFPKPDKTIFLHMPYKYSMMLRNKRQEKPDQHENSEKHLKNAEDTYLLLAKKYNFDLVSCVKENKIRTIDDISSEVFNKVESFILEKDRNICQETL